MENDRAATRKDAEPEERRGFLLSLLTLGSLGAGYGLFGLFAGRFLYPAQGSTRTAKMFVGFTDKVKPRESIQFTSPAGDSYLLTNTGQGIDPYQAFSSRCPHLGCQVHWEGDNQRFVCPCHGGIFDAAGQPLEGPPARDKQSLKQCSIVVEGKSLYALVEVA